MKTQRTVVSPSFHKCQPRHQHSIASVSCAKHFTQEVNGSAITPEYQRRKLRLRQVVAPTRGHTDLNPSPSGPWVDSLELLCAVLKLFRAVLICWGGGVKEIEGLKAVHLQIMGEEEVG